MEEYKSQWEGIGNKCLKLANVILDEEAAPTAATVETVSKLVEIAIRIDTLNLQWASQIRSGAAVFRARPSLQQEAKN